MSEDSEWARRCLDAERVICACARSGSREAQRWVALQALADRQREELLFREITRDDRDIELGVATVATRVEFESDTDRMAEILYRNDALIAGPDRLSKITEAWMPLVVHADDWLTVHIESEDPDDDYPPGVWIRVYGVRI